MATLHERVVALEPNAVQHDKQIKAIRDLVHVGMRMMIRCAEGNGRDSKGAPSIGQERFRT